jgi:hypothetical protein
MTAFHRTGTILRRKGNGSGQEYGKRRVKTPTLKNHEDAAPKIVLTVDVSPTRTSSIFATARMEGECHLHLVRGINVLDCFQYYRHDRDAILTRTDGRGGDCACDQRAYLRGSRMACPRHLHLRRRHP